MNEEVIDWPFTFEESKYSLWYTNLIYKAKNRILPDDVYVEKHHIIPRCITNDHIKENLVKLTAREHYIAHALLWKMKFPGIYGSKMSYAFNTFISMRNRKGHTYKINSRIYEAFRIDYAKMLSKKMKGTGNHFYGKKHSEETRRIIGEKSKQKVFPSGKDHPCWGKKINVSEEGMKRRIAAIKAFWDDPVKREKQLKVMEEVNKRPEVIAKRKLATDKLRGVKRDPDIIEKGAAKRRGKKAEELFSSQALINIAEGRKNRVISEDGKKRMLAGLAKGCRAPMPEHVKKQVSERFKGRTDIPKGELNPNFGKKHSEETKRKMSEKLKGRKYSEEEIAARKISREKHKKECEHCGKIITSNNYTRWHGKNCKNFSK